MSHYTEAILWAALCFSPNGIEVYDPFAAKHYEVKAHYRNVLWSDITYGLDVKTTGPGEDFDWLVVKYTKDPFAPLKPSKREVSHHNKDGSLKEQD